MRAHRLLLVTLLAACGGRATTGPRAPQPAATDAVLAKLTTRQKIGQLVVPWLGGNYMALDDSAFQIATRWIDTLEVGGIIISVGSPYDIAAKLNTLQRRSKVPLLVSADLEWGAAMRVVGATAFPYIMATGATGDQRDAYTIGRIAALEGRAVGIHVGAQVVMSAHIAFPAFTGETPATLSAAMLTGVLRDSLKFKGLVVTDALQMGAIVAKYGAGEAAVRAFEAGSDLLLMPADPDSAIASMLVALQTGRLTPARLDASVRRVLEIKRGLGLFERRTVPLDSIAHIVGSKAFQDAADDLAQRSLTLVRDTAGTVTRLRSARSRMAVIAYGDELNSYVGQRMLELLRAGGDTVGFFRLWPMSGSASYDSARVVIGRAPTVVFAMNVRPIAAKGNIALPDSLARLITMTDSVKPTVLVSLGSPYLLNQTPTVKSYLIAWSGVRPAERAAARALLGWSPVRGKF